MNLFWTARLAAIGALSALIATGVSGTVRAGVKSTTKYQYYSVAGRTSLELVRSMYARGPRHWGNGYILAQLRTNADYQAKMANRGRGCRVTDMTQRFRFTIILPRLRGERRLDRRTRSRWRAFVRYLDRHEKVHRRIWQQCGRAIERAARRLPGRSSCAALRSDVRSLVSRMRKACKVKQDNFDRRDYKTTNKQPLIRHAIAQNRNAKRRAVAANRPRGRKPGRASSFRTGILKCCD